MNNIINMIMQAKQNPMAIISQRFKIPQNIQKPQDMAQYLLNTGQITQAQLNDAVQTSKSPQFKQFMK